MVNNNNNNCNIKYSVNFIFITIIEIVIIGITGVRNVRTLRTGRDVCTVRDVRTVRASVSNTILLFVVLNFTVFFSSQLYSTTLLQSLLYYMLHYIKVV